MNLKNHTTFRPWQLSGDRGDKVPFALGATYKWSLKDCPPHTRNLANYLVGLVVTVTQVVVRCGTPEARSGVFTQNDIIRGLFESAEIQQTMFGTPVSANHYKGEYFGLFSYIANGMQEACPVVPPIMGSTEVSTAGFSFFIPTSALLGMKGHHTAQPVCCYDRGQFILRTRLAPNVEGMSYVGGGEISVSAILNPEPELRLGPGTSFMRYTMPANANQTIINVDNLGNSSTLESVEPGAGLAWFAWLANQNGLGGAGSPAGIEFLNVPFRDIQQTRHLDPFFIDFLNASGGRGQWIEGQGSGYPLAGGPVYDGYLYHPYYQMNGAGGTNGVYAPGANFLPIVTPHAFLETSKLQTVQGSQTVNMKSSTPYSGEHVFAALQFHSWTPAKQEEVLRKLIDSGTAMAVWGTNDLVPKIKVTNKQPSGSLNPKKTRYFAMTWEPREKVATPPAAA